MSDPQGAPTNDPWAPQSSSSQNPSQGSVPSTPQVPQTPQAQQPWGAPEQPAQPQQQWGAAPQPDAAWQGTQAQGGTAWTVAQP